MKNEIHLNKLAQTLVQVVLLVTMIKRTMKEKTLRHRPPSLSHRTLYKLKRPSHICFEIKPFILFYFHFAEHIVSINKPFMQKLHLMKGIFTRKDEEHKADLKKKKKDAYNALLQ